MIIKSMAGEFDISIEGFEIEGRHLVMVGRMGVWDARTYITGPELLTVLGRLLRPGVLFGIVTVIFRRAAREPKPQTEESND